MIFVQKRADVRSAFQVHFEITEWATHTSIEAQNEEHFGQPSSIFMRVNIGFAYGLSAIKFAINFLTKCVTYALRFPFISITLIPWIFGIVLCNIHAMQTTQLIANENVEKKQQTSLLFSRLIVSLFDSFFVFCCAMKRAARKRCYENRHHRTRITSRAMCQSCPWCKQMCSFLAMGVRWSWPPQLHTLCTLPIDYLSTFVCRLYSFTKNIGWFEPHKTHDRLKANRRATNNSGSACLYKNLNHNR